MKRRTYFSGNPLDRRSWQRSNLAIDLSAKMMIFNEDKFLLETPHQIKWVRAREFPTLNINRFQDFQTVFLGVEKEESYWAIQISSSNDVIEWIDKQKFGSFVEARPNVFQLSTFEGSIFGLAAAAIDWNRNIHCSGCGSLTESAESGFKRICLNSECESRTTVKNYSHIRTDGVAIVNIVSPCGEKILLGRQKKWPKLRYSCIAGFIEPGESLEECAAREVLEEVGVTVEEIRYITSQPWPFPSQLMFGFIAKAKSTDIDIESRDRELEHAQWFDRASIQRALRNENPDLQLPPAYAIAHTLMKSWADRE